MRELLLNVVKHAKATELSVAIQYDDQELAILVADNGLGFDPEPIIRPADNSTFGHFSIRERLDALGGRFEIDSGKGKGTRITLVVPID